jgi:hypothetical protein
MTIEELQKQIDAIEFPILTSGEDPKQLYLYKWGEYVESYDPVWSMKIIDDKLVIVWFINNEYVYSLSDFDTIKVEPYISPYAED